MTGELLCVVVDMYVVLLCVVVCCCVLCVLLCVGLCCCVLCCVLCVVVLCVVVLWLRAVCCVLCAVWCVLCVVCVVCVFCACFVRVVRVLCACCSRVVRVLCACPALTAGVNPGPVPVHRALPTRAVANQRLCMITGTSIPTGTAPAAPLSTCITGASTTFKLQLRTSTVFKRLNQTALSLHNKAL